MYYGYELLINIIMLHYNMEDTTENGVYLWHLNNKNQINSI